MTDPTLQARLAEAARKWVESYTLEPMEPHDALQLADVILEALSSRQVTEDDVVEDFLHELGGWERAYPPSIFPEPDMRKAAELLEAGGMTLDVISASNMRHVVSRIAPKARAAIEAMRS